MTQPGRKLRTSSGYYAFLPDPLPPELKWTPDLVRSLSNADRAIGKLAGVCVTDDTGGTRQAFPQQNRIAGLTA